MKTSVEKTVDDYRFIAKAVARRFAYLRPGLLGHVELQDLEQFALLGLWDAAKTYDRTKSGEFTGYAFRIVPLRMLDHLRKELPLTRGQVKQINEHGYMLTDHGERLEPHKVVPLDQHVSDSTDSDITFVDILADTSLLPLDAGLITEADKEIIQGAMTRLPEREEFVLYLIMWEGLSQTVVADMLGVTEGRVSQLIKQAVDRLRAMASRQLAA